jgi:hypothetical protein
MPTAQTAQQGVASTPRTCSQPLPNWVGDSIAGLVGAAYVGGNASREDDIVSHQTQQQIAKRPTRPTTTALDLRSPSGRALPY